MKIKKTYTKKHTTVQRKVLVQIPSKSGLSTKQYVAMFEKINGLIPCGAEFIRSKK